MYTRTVFLIVYAAARVQRAHFSIWVPDAEGAQQGSRIHVVGNPMIGYFLEFKRDYEPLETKRVLQLIEIGPVLVQHLSEISSEAQDMPRNNLEMAATQIQPPRANPNFLTTTSSDSQTWMLEYVRHLVTLGYLDEAAIDIVQSNQDPPQVGIRLRPTAARPR
ncbi:hypothetical protein GGP41_000884 [Bipolaris sorokiniana]|uniref:Uncharacterized protein n=1 Tax=Cochliobolus sativus TaxID=45130 RepID=A0A8H6DXK0_COCSA|nr:hypothetical protein GGP41_000884 [Bipolaris sorokiniana]